MNNKQKQFYISKFRNKIFVLKIGGEVIQSASILESILKDVRDIYNCGVQIIIVHGGGPQADVLAKKLGHEPEKINGRRVTSATDVEVIKMLYGGSLNLEILSLMKKLGFKGIRVSGLDGDLLTVKLRSKKKIDFGFVGDIKKVNPPILKDLLSVGYIPVVSPLAATDKGVIVNINADTIATEIAIAICAEKLILFTNRDGVMSGSNLISTITITEAKQMLKKGIVNSGMAIKLSNCLKAVDSGVKRVHIVNGLSTHSLLGEVLTKKGVGTMVLTNHEKNKYFVE